MTDLILIAILTAIVGGAVLYIRKEKKRGVKCIGCPAAGTCSRNQAGGTTCSGGCHTDAN